MRKALAVILFSVSLLMAATWNIIPVPGASNVVYRACRIDSAFAGQTRYTPWFNYGDYENPTVQCRFDDTTNAGFQGDSIVAYYFIQRGLPSISKTYQPDTQACITPYMIDTIDALTDGNWVVLTPQTVNDTDIAKALDSTGTSGYGVNAHSLSTYWAPFARIGVVFLTGTKIAPEKAVRFSVDVIQRKYIKTDLYPRERPEPQ